MRRSPFSLHRAPPSIAALVAVLCAGSCASDTASPGTSETDVAIMRLSVANQQITVDQTGSVTGGPVVLRAGIPATVTAVFLTATGEADPRIVRATYQLNASVVGSEPVTFTRSTTDPFSGTLSCNAPNVTAHVRFSLYNVELQHDTWGPFEVAISVAY
jgi:hypothetical protein